MQRGGDPLIFCFVDFADPACAATAMGALQGDFIACLLVLNLSSVSLAVHQMRKSEK